MTRVVMRVVMILMRVSSGGGGGGGGGGEGCGGLELDDLDAANINPPPYIIIVITNIINIKATPPCDHHLRKTHLETPYFNSTKHFFANISIETISHF